jgi:hypothetical protein
MVKPARVERIDNDAIYSVGDRLRHDSEGEVRPEDNRDLRAVEPDFSSFVR